MEAVTLELQTRSQSVKPKSLLKESLLPIEFYGKGVKNLSLQVDYQTFRRIFKKAGMNTVIEILVDGKDKFDVLVQDVEYDPVSEAIMHADLINVRKDQEIHAKIPVKFTGFAIAVKDLGGTLTTHIDELEVKCLPKDLIHSIEVDLAPLVDFNAYIRVKDLNVPAALQVMHDPEDVVATVVPPRVEEEAAPAAPEEGAEGAPAEGQAAAADGSADQSKEKGKE